MLSPIHVEPVAGLVGICLFYSFITELHVFVEYHVILYMFVYRHREYGHARLQDYRNVYID